MTAKIHQAGRYSGMGEVIGKMGMGLKLDREGALVVQAMKGDRDSSKRF